MTDAPEPDERAERAFRDALTSRAETFEPAALDASGGRHRRRWLPALVAAAVLALVGGTALAAAVFHDDKSGGTHLAGKDDLAVGTLPAADAGWRWVSWRNVAVQVPEDWADGNEPGPDWCASTGAEPELPPAPYVSRNDSAGMTLSIGCPAPEDGRPAIFGDAPQNRWAPHLTFAPTGAAEAPRDGVTEFDGWRVEATTLDTVQLRLWTDADTADLGELILTSARTFTTDDDGCDVTSPVEATEFVRPRPAFDVQQVDEVDSISVCQYDRHVGAGAVALMASRRLTGGAASRLLAGIKDASTGGGPDYPDQCVHDAYGDHAIALRLHHDGTTDDAYVYYDWCFGNGIDDGTTRYELTADNCAPLFGDELIAWQYQSALRHRCG